MIDWQAISTYVYLANIVGAGITGIILLIKAAL